MNRLLILPVLLLTLLVGNPAFSADFQKGKEAYNKGDYATALKEFIPLAERGDAEAQMNLGLMYGNGDGVPQDDRTSAKWLALAAKQGDSIATIAQLLLIPVFAKHHVMEAYKRGDYATALKEFRPLAEKGFVTAQFFLGLMHASGEGVQQDYKIAIKWYKLAAGQGEFVAHFNLGQIYRFGYGVPKNLAEAAKWYQKPAKYGDVEAQLLLGLMYERGMGVPQNYDKAVKLFRLAAIQGHAIAQYSLGLMYGRGQGVPEDYILAYMWFNLSAAQGNKDAVKDRDIVRKAMTAAQLAAAQRLTRECLKKNYQGC